LHPRHNTGGIVGILINHLFLYVLGWFGTVKPLLSIVGLILVQANAQLVLVGTPSTSITIRILGGKAHIFTIIARLIGCQEAGRIVEICDWLRLVSSIAIQVGGSLFRLFGAQAETKDASPITPATGLTLRVGSGVASTLCILGVHARRPTGNIVGIFEGKPFLLIMIIRTKAVNARNLDNESLRLFLGNTDTGESPEASHAS
jgi:hypothetical protein